MENTTKGKKQKYWLGIWENQKLKTILVTLSLIVAWLIGNQLEVERKEKLLSSYFPEWKTDKKLADGLFSLSKENISIYAAESQSNGYGGPLSIILLVKDSLVNKVIVSGHKETPSYFNKVLKSDLFHIFNGKNINEVRSLKPDAISGATKSADAFVNATISASKIVAKTIYKVEIHEDLKVPLKIGFAEMVIILLFGVAITSWYIKPKIRKTLHTISLFISIVFVGFIFNQQITISMISSLLNGYILPLQSNLPVYLLIFFLVLSLIIWNKNTYCEWVCPFGAAQSIIGKIGNAKTCPAGKNRKTINNILGGIVWLAIISSLLLKNPGAISYEVFNGLFRLTGASLLFVLLIATLITSLFVKRPWCRYLCPITPSAKYIQNLRKLFNPKRNGAKAIQ